MKLLKTVITVFVAGIALTAGAAAAQTPPPVGQKPTPPPTPPPGAQTQKPAEPRPPAPFPEGAKFAIIDVQFILNASEEGKKVLAQMNELANKKNAELADKRNKIEAETKKFEDAQRVGMNEQARLQKERELRSMARDIEDSEADAQKEVQAFQNKVFGEFLQKVEPILQSLVKEKGLHMVFRAEPAVIAWADEGLNLSDEIVTRLNATKGAAPKK